MHAYHRIFKQPAFIFEDRHMAREYNFIGRQIGNYRILEELASGSFGRVYRGVHIYLTTRIVAIKLLHRMYLGSQKERESFLQEAQLLELLKHPHILPVYDVGINYVMPYFLTEYASHVSLRDRLQEQYPQHLPVDETITILTQVGEALFMPTIRILFTAISNRKTFFSMPTEMHYLPILVLPSFSRRPEPHL